MAGHRDLVGRGNCGARFLIFGVIPFLADHASDWVSPRLEAELGNRLADFIIAFTADRRTKTTPNAESQGPSRAR